MARNKKSVQVMKEAVQHSISKAVGSLELVKQLDKVIKGKRTIKRSTNMITDKITDGIEEALYSIWTSFNEVSRAELENYIKTHKNLAAKAPEKVVLNVVSTIVSATTEKKDEKKVA